MSRRFDIKIFQWNAYFVPVGFLICVAIATISPPAFGAPETADLLTARRDAEARAAIAEAERAELLARLPPSTAKAPAGTTDVRQFGAAGLVKAFDLARELAAEVCAVLPFERKTVVYEPATAQGVLAARLVLDAISRYSTDLGRLDKDLQAVIEAHTPKGSAIGTFGLALLTAVPATVKAAADMSALARSDVGAEGLAYGDGARSLFVTSLGRACPERIGGFGAGYLGELDGAHYDGLLAKVRTLAARRGEVANRIATVQRLADTTKGEDKKELTAVASAGGALLKTVDAFVDSLRAGEVGDRSPLFNAARYLAYAARTERMLVLDFDLRLEGLSIVKDGLFTSQRLRLVGVAFLWYRLHETDGSVRVADAVRRMTRPVEVDLRGEVMSGEFWSGK